MKLGNCSAIGLLLRGMSSIARYLTVHKQTRKSYSAISIYMYMMFLASKESLLSKFINEPGQSISYKTACALNDVSDQPANPHSLISLRKAICG